MLDTIDGLSGDRLELDPYLDDFDGRLASLRNTDIWKLERRQVFHQPECDSWMAFREGRHDESLRLLENNRSSLREEFAELARAGCALRRTRVVEKPFTTYLLWELHSLHLRAQCGEDVRIISPDPLAAWEHSGHVPEIVGLGDEVTYKIRYDDQGVLRGGVRFTDHATTTRCRAQITALHETGEDLKRYFPREVEGPRSAVTDRTPSEPGEDPEERPGTGGSAQMGAVAGRAVQARDVRGGVHFHGQGPTAHPAPVPGQLPGDVHGFVNRVGELEVLSAHLRAEDSGHDFDAGSAAVLSGLLVRRARRVLDMLVAAHLVEQDGPGRLGEQILTSHE